VTLPIDGQSKASVRIIECQAELARIRIDALLAPRRESPGAQCVKNDRGIELQIACDQGRIDADRALW